LDLTRSLEIPRELSVPAYRFEVRIWNELFCIIAYVDS
jgi:hypothetical protein